MGLEGTPGTAVAAGFWLPLTTMTPTETIPLLLDQSMRGSAAKDYGSQPGPTSVSYALAGNLIPDAVGFPLVGILGEDVVTGTGAPYSHVSALYNAAGFQPPSYTIVDVNGLEAISYAGAKFSDFELTIGSDALATYTATAVGSSAASTSTLPTVSYSTVPPIAGWKTAVQIGGSADVLETDLTLTFKRTVDPIFTLQNLQTARNIFTAGDLEVTGKITTVFEVATLRNDYRTGTSTTLDVLIANGLTGAAASSLELHCSNIVLSAATVTRGKTYVELDSEFTAIANGTDVGASGGFSPVKATLLNAVAAGTYHS
jgi:hypothetical protein